ncbi:unnamed protein product, partial [Didymodactylos carnosus]
EQSGFRSAHSTTTRFTQFIQDVSTSLQQHTAALVLYIDFSKAFDQLWRRGLIYKLHKLRCPKELLQFIIEYLDNRTCQIEINGLLSAVFDVDRGVPQGSVLGPVLFLLFHADMPTEIPSAQHTHMYADDVALVIDASPWWKSTEVITNIQKIAQQTLNELQKYSSRWKQPINYIKTEYQWIHKRITISSIVLLIDQHELARTNLFKYLGYYIDQKLSFNKHVQNILTKIKTNTPMITYVAQSKTSSYHARTLIFNAYVLPYFQQLYSIYPLLPDSTKDKIEARNRQVYRVINRWYDATNDEIKLTHRFETITDRAKKILRNFINKAHTVIPELFEKYTQSGSMQMYLQMHNQSPFIQYLNVGRQSATVKRWLDQEDRYLDKLMSFIQD